MEKVKDAEELKKKEQNDFIEFLNNDSFNPYNLFICKKLEILQDYYKSIFYFVDSTFKNRYTRTRFRSN